MRIAAVMMVVSAAGMLAGCNKSSVADDGRTMRGRFGGIGVYDAGRVWRHMTAPDPKDPALARLADDEHVIAVVDSRTGEVRQCGDHSGFCVAMNPWAGSPPPALPVRLSKHSADLDKDNEVIASPPPAAPGR